MSDTNTSSLQSAAAPDWQVLLVEDEPVQRMLVARMLTRAGYQVLTAADGEQALQVLTQNEVSLVITDWEMPKLDGLGLCRQLRAMQLDRYVYTLILTSRNAIEHVVMGLQAGADDYLVKPIVEPELLARLNAGKRLLTMERSLRLVNAENLRLSVTDPLTNVFNRRYLMEHLQRELERSQRYSHPLSLILCDIDHFKSINDQHGHQAGDAVLSSFAKLLRQALRDTDWIARYGGEEFVVVLPETNITNATKVAERCRLHVMQSPSIVSELSLAVTASFGVTGWEPGMRMEALLDKFIAAADAGMYASKSAGRNRVTVQALQAA